MKLFRILLVLALLVAISSRSGFAWIPNSTGNDLPGPPSHIETIPAGSLVIPMDNTLQNLVTPFNLKAYGLVNRFLQVGIPVKWVIRAGKGKDGIDFTANAQRIAPTTGAASSFNFSGGPFIVHKDFAQLALAYIANFGGSVAVYQLTADATVDTRYDLTQRPNIAVNTANASIHTDLYDFAGIPNYTVIDVTVAGAIGANSCFTHFSEPHTNLVAGIPQVKAFVQSGGNFLAECLAIDTYENGGLFQTTGGITTANTSVVPTYPNPDLAFSQFVGILTAAPGGSHQDWVLNTGSVFQNNTHVHADDTGTSPAAYAATVAKLSSGAGGNVFYIGGHSYGAGGTTLSDINGQRMILNAIFVPANRPGSCGLDFIANLRTFTGQVVEDVNGDGNLSDAVASPNVNVRLYADLNNNGVVDAGDTYLGTTTTDASGNYTLRASTYATGNFYLVVVDSKSITPSAGLRSGFTQGDVWADQTYGDNSTTAAFDLGVRFGGATPAVSDNFNAANTAPASNNYRHIARFNAAAGDVSGLNFGFSFNVVTNVNGGSTTDDDTSNNRTVQGSLRQFIQNANAITGANTMRFVPAVAANAGSWWRISVTSALPAISDANTTIDGVAYNSTDGTTVRDTNAGTIGAGGTVGVDALALATVNKPELELQNLRSSGVVALGLDVQAANVAIRRLAIFGFGAAANVDTSASIRVGATGTNALIEQNVIGSGAGAFTDPGTNIRSTGDQVRLVGATGTTLQNNLIGFSGGNGVALSTGTSGAQILANEIRGNAQITAALSGLSVGSGTAATVQGNLFASNRGAGAEVANGAGAMSIVNNSFTGNGVGATVNAGVRLLGASTTVDRNIITSSTGAGVLVTATAAQNTITRNSIYQNGGIGIDLLAAANNQNTGTSPFVTPNDSGDADTGGNDLQNFPILSSAGVLGPNLVVTGFAQPGTVIELFLADADPSKFGEGRSYLATVTEGSAGDGDATTGTYTNPVNGINQGTDTTNKFSFTIPLPPGVTGGVVLTATGTLGNATSEFSGYVTVTAVRPIVSGYVYADANLNLQMDDTESGTGITLYVKLVSTASPLGPAVAVVAVDPVTGGYGFSGVANGTYTLVLDNNNTLSDVTPNLPLGWSGTEMGTGLRTPVAVAAGTDVPNLNFGLFHGLLLRGRVFNDTGATGGTANDGILNGAEGGMAAVNLTLTDASGTTTYATTTTDGAGNYALAIPSGIAAGTPLKVVETNSAGALSTGATVGNTGGSYDRNTDTITFTLTANTSYTNVNFGDVAGNSLTSDGQQSGLPGTTLFYAHSFTAQSGGTVTFTRSSTQTPALSGWTTTLYRDTNANGQIDAGEPAITAPINVNAGDTIALLVKKFIPTNASLGAKDQTTLTASFSYTNANPALAATLKRQDVTTVGDPTTAGLTLLKKVDKPSALPGQTITYTVTYTNTSTDVLSNVVIYDDTPAFTKFASASNGALPLDLTSVVANTPAVGATGGMKWNFTGTLRPGGTGTVTFQVTVDQ